MYILGSREIRIQIPKSVLLIDVINKLFMLASSYTFSSWPLVAPDYSDSINLRRSDQLVPRLACALAFIKRTHQIVLYDIGNGFNPIGSFVVDCLAISSWKSWCFCSIPGICCEPFYCEHSARYIVQVARLRPTGRQVTDKSERW